MQKFSVIIPTYTGIQTIKQTLDSLLKQNVFKIDYEVIAIIDGPSQDLRKLLNAEKKRFSKRNISFTVRQFSKNRGRFEARIAGAELSRFNQLLFIDDRVRLASGFFNQLTGLKEEVAIPAVTELPSSNVISKTLNLLRRWVYGDKWGSDFGNYYIDRSNFEISPKGTAGLWINKGIFLEACSTVHSSMDIDSRFVNEDTKILKEIVESGTRILRTAKLKIYYQPRDDLKASLKHLYERGPRFINYYGHPGTRFFPLLVFIYSLILALVLVTVMKFETLYWLVFALVVLIVLCAIAIARNIKEFITALAGLPLIGASFALGVLIGTLRIVKGWLNR